MFILNKETKQITSLNNVMRVFVGESGNTVSVKLINGSVVPIKQYANRCEAEEAILMLSNALAVNNQNIFPMPEVEEVENRLRNKPPEKHHHATGKKTKGHGGS